MNSRAIPDEFPIVDIPATPWWSENFAAMWSSPQQRTAVFYSIGRWHSDPTVWRELIMIALPDQRVAFSKGFARNGTKVGPGGPLSKYDVIEPGEKVRLTFDGPMSVAPFSDLVAHGSRGDVTKRCKLRLDFDSAAPLWNMKGDSFEAGTVAGSIHIDHIGKANGSIEFDGKTYPFTDGYVARDHSRGAREVSQYGGHNWINAAFPGGRAFYLYAMRSQGSKAIGMSNAAIAQDGKLYPAELIHTEFISSLSDHDKTHKLVLGSELGQMEIEIIEVLNSLPSSMVCPYDTIAGSTKHRPAAHFFDEAVRMRWNGQEAYGWSERGFAEKPLG